MTVGLLFWILFIVGFVFQGYRSGTAWIYSSILWWILIGLLGYGVFGWPIK